MQLDVKIIEPNIGLQERMEAHFQKFSHQTSASTGDN